MRPSYPQILIVVALLIGFALACGHPLSNVKLPVKLECPPASEPAIHQMLELFLRADAEDLLEERIQKDPLGTVCLVQEARTELAMMVRAGQADYLDALERADAAIDAIDSARKAVSGE